MILLLRWVTHKPRFDLVLALALLLAVLFCLHGIRWGRVECWNRDQMALRALAGLRPGDYSKPPFHTYLNHLLIIEPIKLPLRIAHVPRERQNQVNGTVLLGSRLLTLALYLGTILFAYAISLRCYGQVAAQIIALLFATSAGFVAFAHFLTVDLPVLFWMMAAFFFGTQVVFRGKTFDYVCCGYLTGIATATKYNGLAVGLVLVVAHVLASKHSGWQKLVFSRQLFLGLLMVPIGFIAGNPYGVLRDWNRFRTDFRAGSGQNYVEGTGQALQLTERTTTMAMRRNYGQFAHGGTTYHVYESDQKVVPPSTLFKLAQQVVRIGRTVIRIHEACISEVHDGRYSEKIGRLDYKEGSSGHHHKASNFGEYGLLPVRLAESSKTGETHDQKREQCSRIFGCHRQPKCKAGYKTAARGRALTLFPEQVQRQEAEDGHWNVRRDQHAMGEKIG